MKKASVVVVAVLLGTGSLAGCGGTGADSRPERRIELGLDRQTTGQLSDKDLVEIRGQIHQASLSRMAALKAAKDMDEAERGSREAAQAGEK